MSGFLSTMVGVSPIAAATGRTAATITAVGQAQISTAQSKFGGASAVFDGTGDVLYSSDIDNVNMAGNFTIECWFRFNALNRNQYIFTNRWSGSYTNGDWVVFHSVDNQRIQIASPDFTQININASGNYTTNTWYHFALVRSGSTLTAYLNGVNKGTATHTATIFETNKKLIIGAQNESGSSSLLGNIDEVRISNIARYTADFTANTIAFANDANTLLLLHMDGVNGSTTFTDDVTGNNPSMRADSYASFLKLAVPFDSVNNANDVAYLVSGTGLSSSATKTQGTSSTITTDQIKWTSSPNYQKSLKNTRSDQALTYALPTSMPTSASGSYVVEGWFYATDSSTNSNWVLSSADSGGRWLLGLNTGSSSQFAGENWVGIGTGWHHCAIVCDAGTKRFYVDGIYKGAFSTSNTGFSTLHVGQFNAGDSNDFLGHIQDLRVYIGTNKGYTGTNTGSANFTLPSSIIQSF